MQPTVSAAYSKCSQQQVQPPTVIIIIIIIIIIIVIISIIIIIISEIESALSLVHTFISFSNFLKISLWLASSLL